MPTIELLRLIAEALELESNDPAVVAAFDRLGLRGTKAARNSLELPTSMVQLLVVANPRARLRLVCGRLPACWEARPGDQLEGGAMSQDDDLIAGWRYSATWQLRTPLAYLEMDGEFSPGPKEPPLVGPEASHLPDGTGFNPYGCWVREIDYKGLDFSPPPPPQRSTQWGPVRVGSSEEKELLSFLKSFRYIVETAETLDQKLAELTELSTSTPANRRVWQKVVASDPGFPDSFFYGELCDLPGVGLKVAERLYRAGFRTVEEIQAASDAELLPIEGLGKKVISKIRTESPA